MGTEFLNIINKMNNKQKLYYSISLAKLAVDKFNKYCPKDKRANQALAEAEKYLYDNNIKRVPFVYYSNMGNYAAYSAIDACWATALGAHSVAFALNNNNDVDGALYATMCFFYLSYYIDRSKKTKQIKNILIDISNEIIKTSK